MMQDNIVHLIRFMPLPFLVLSPLLKVKKYAVYT